MASTRRPTITADELEVWPSPELGGLSEKKRVDFERKKSAIVQYASGASHTKIQKHTGISRGFLHYLLPRCQAIAPDLRVWGFRALIAGVRIVKSRRHSFVKLETGKALPGSFDALLDRYPDLRQLMFNAVVHGIDPRSKRKNLRLTWAQIHDIFLEQCISLGIRAPHYPFCSESKGLYALKRWKRGLEKARALTVLPDSSSQNALSPAPVRCYRVVECDGHFVDVEWTINFESLRGEGITEIRITRIWLIALIEIVSSAVLGYSISLEKNYSGADVVRAIKSSLESFPLQRSHTRPDNASQTHMHQSWLTYAMTSCIWTMR